MTKFNYNKSANNAGSTAQRFLELLQKAKDKGVTGLTAFNAESGDIYQGKNAIILNYVASLYKNCTAFLTWKQIESLGGSVKGQHGYPVCKVIEKIVIDDQGNEHKTKMVKYYTVFNLAQVHRRELDDQETEVKEGKRAEVDLDCYEPIAVHYLKPKTADQAVEVPSDQIEVIAPKAQKTAKKAAKKTAKKTVTKVAKEITFKNSFIPAMWDSASASYSDVSYQ